MDAKEYDTKTICEGVKCLWSDIGERDGDSDSKRTVKHDGITRGG
jgi:hypothetical protein